MLVKVSALKMSSIYREHYIIEEVFRAQTFLLVKPQAVDPFLLVKVSAPKTKQLVLLSFMLVKLQAVGPFVLVIMLMTIDI